MPVAPEGPITEQKPETDWQIRKPPGEDRICSTGGFTGVGLGLHQNVSKRKLPRLSVTAT